jgi:hypothetical protein
MIDWTRCSAGVSGVESPPLSPFSLSSSLQAMVNAAAAKARKSSPLTNTFLSMDHLSV